MTPREGGFRPVPLEEQETQRDAALSRIPEAFASARAYWQARNAEGQAGVPRHERDVRWEAMGPALRGEVPVFVHASSENQIRAALAFLEEQQIPRAVLVGGADAEAVAPELAARDIPVIVAGTLRTPARDSDPYDRAFSLPARLQAAGVRFCIADEGSAGEAANARNLPYHAAMAAAFGLSPEDALRAITLYPAQILGVETELGAIEPGRLADLVVTDGPPLEITSAVERVYISGHSIPLESRHTRLFERWRARPRPAEGETR
jgi:imidazolonepropionase-like amidohydrolase